MNCIGILTKPKFPDVRPILKALVAWLRDKGKEVFLDGKTSALIGEPTPYQKSEIATKSELIIVLGGDGTMLSAARLVEEHGVPILGVNMGGLGFLTEIAAEDMYSSLERIFSNDYYVDERRMLRTRMHRHGEHVAHATVLNDVVVSKGTLARMIELQITVDGELLTSLRGDGLIVSTPTGSTAYSLSAGGPIIHPSVEAVILTPICPHTLTHRPLLVHSQVTIEVTLASKDDGAMTTFDGQVGIAMSQGDTVVIEASGHQTRLIRFHDRTYYDVLRQKLKWGA